MSMRSKALIRRLAVAAATALLAAAVQAAGPSGIAGLTLLLEADAGLTLDGSGNVITWQDQSAQHHDASGVSGWFAQVNGASMNGIAVPTFNGSYLQIAGQPVTSQRFTVFTVAATGQTASSDGLREVVSNWSFSNTVTSVFLGTVGDSAQATTRLRLTDGVGGATDPINLQTGVSNVPNPAAGFVLTGVSGATSAELYLGQTLAHSAGALTPRDLSGAWVIGAQGETGGEYWSGQIAALIIYDRALSAQERGQVIDDLGQKYLGLPAVPEPASTAMLLAGLVAVGGMAARARRRAAGAGRAG